MRLPKFSGKPKRPKKFGLLLRRVQGESMRPGLTPQQIVLARYTKKVRPGQVVIANHKAIQIIKRVDKMQDGLVYLLGDNLSRSTDSRTFGWVSADVIVAKVIWPRM